MTIGSHTSSKPSKSAPIRIGAENLSQFGNGKRQNLSGYSSGSIVLLRPCPFRVSL